MKFIKISLMVLAATLLCGVCASSSRADQWNKKTVLTFNQPVEIPGSKVLPAGSYVFKLLDSVAYRHIVQVWNEDETHLITTILAVPNYRLEPTGETAIEFHERPAGRAQALRAWFYPGDNFGQEFVYSKARAIQLAEASNEIVPAEVTEPTESTLKTVPLVAITPKDKEEPVTEAIQVFPMTDSQKATAAGTPVAETKELPKTASPIPLIGLLGFAFLALAGGLKLLVKQLS